MGDFYGYDPSRFVVPDRYGIGAASQSASQTVMNVSQAVSQKKEAEAKEKERQEKIRLAAEAIAKDKNGMRLAYDSVLKNYTRMVNSLVKEGVLTQEEADQKLGTLYSLEPTDIALKDPMKYLTALNEANISFMNDLGKIKKEFETQRSQGRVTGAVTQAMRGTPAVPGSPATPDQTVVNPETISAGVGRGALRAPMNAWGDAETTTIPGTPAIEPQAAIPPAQDKEETYLRTQEYLKNQKQPLATQTQLDEAGIENQRNRIAEGLEEKKLEFAKEKEQNDKAYNDASLALAKSQNARGLKEDQRKIENDTFEKITTQQDKTTDNLSNTRSQLTTATSLKSKVKNIQNGQVSQDILDDLKTLGMDPNQAILNPSGIINDLDKIINTLKITEELQKKYNADYNKALLQWIRKPDDPLPKILEDARQSVYPNLGEQAMSSPFSKQIQTRERPLGQTTLPGSTKKKQKIGQFIVEEE
jgi:hypothetical protein